MPIGEPLPSVWLLAELEWPEEKRALPSVPLEANDIAEIVFTSGATGEPKGIIITHRNILANIVSPEQIIAKYAKWFRPVFPIRFLVLIPLSHILGQVLALFVAPLIPGTVVFMRGYSPHEILRQIRRRRASVVDTVPKILDILRAYILRQLPEATAPQAMARRLWTLRWWKYRRTHALFGWKFWAFVVGAAPLTKEVELFWAGLGFDVIQGYGLTETAPIITFNNPFDTREGTVGNPCHSQTATIAKRSTPESVKSPRIGHVSASILGITVR